MMNRKSNADSNGAAFPLVAVAIDKDKGSQSALKWAIDNLVSKGQSLTLVHVNTKSTSSGGNNEDGQCYKAATDPQTKELFLPFRCFCTRKDIQCQDVVIEATDVPKAIVEFVSQSAVEKLVVGAPSRGGFVRFKTTDISSSISKGAPDFCTVYVISKGKVSSMRNAVRAAPTISPLRAQLQNQAASIKHDAGSNRGSLFTPRASEQSPEIRTLSHESIKSPFLREGRGGLNTKLYPELSYPDSDISFVSSGRPSIDRPPRLSNVSDSLDRSFESVQTPLRSSMESYSMGNDFNSFSSGTSWSSQNMDDIEAEMRRLKLELKQTMDMYSAACKEALTAKQKAVELHRWKREEEQRLEEARISEEAALAMVERERAKCRAAIEAAEAAQRIAEIEAQKRINAEMKALKEAEERKKIDTCTYDIRYRRYTIEEIEKATNYFANNRKIGEGGYGPVYRCHLDHTPVAIKVLRPDAAQGRSQFQQEVEVLSCIRHPHMVLLLGACPEYGCLVYEYMANGSLDDRLFRRGGTPVIPWQHRFRIAAEIATGLLFLHQTKPEPLVHRDLKPGNILLDSNYISKISDVGLARLVPPSVADTVTQYRMTSTAGTFCYIDPEYQQTGMLGVKSDIYSLGILLLQIITAKPPMGLTHHVGRAIEKGAFAEMLDPAVTDWPVEEAQKFAEISLQCAELRRKDRPDLATVVLPELNRLRELGEENMQHCLLRSTYSSPMHSQASQLSIQDVMSDPLMQSSGYDSSRNSSASNGRKSSVS